MRTEKLYYEDYFLKECEATVIAVGKQGVVCDQTVAFPEGGGQEGDRGFLIINENEKIAFTDTQKGVGDVFLEQDFPTINVNTPIYHCVAEEALEKFEVGMKIKVCIDIERRARLTVSHTAIHLVLMAIEKIRGEKDIIRYVKGAAIKEEDARLDFFFREKLNDEQLDKINEYVNQIIADDCKIELYPHAKQKEAVYWKCLDYICACGGTHLPSTKYVGAVSVIKKSKGKNLQRITVKFPNVHSRYERNA